MSAPAGTLINWTGVPTAWSYNVVRGDLDGLLELPNSYDFGVVTCIESDSLDTTTSGYEDAILPAPGKAFFYLIEYKSTVSSSFGTESAQKPRATHLDRYEMDQGLCQ